jgi:hypothetical protein
MTDRGDGLVMEYFNSRGVRRRFSATLGHDPFEDS